MIHGKSPEKIEDTNYCGYVSTLEGTTQVQIIITSFFGNFCIYFPRRLKVLENTMRTKSYRYMLTVHYGTEWYRREFLSNEKNIDWGRTILEFTALPYTRHALTQRHEIGLGLEWGRCEERYRKSFVEQCPIWPVWVGGENALVFFCLTSLSDGTTVSTAVVKLRTHLRVPPRGRSWL